MVVYPMSIYNPKHNALFIHVPKTAGTSITRVLEQLPGDPARVEYSPGGLGKHAKAVEIRRQVGDSRGRLGLAVTAGPSSAASALGYIVWEE